MVYIEIENIKSLQLNIPDGERGLRELEVYILDSKANIYRITLNILEFELEQLTTEEYESRLFSGE